MGATVPTSRYGQGSVYLDKTSGLYVGRVELGYGPDGRRLRKKVKARTKQAVLIKMREVQTAKEQGLPTPDRQTTTGDWLTLWATEVLPRSVKASTAQNYRVILDTYVLPHVGKVPLARLTPEHVEKMMTALEAKGLSPRTVGYARAVLRRALGVAYKRGKVARNAAAMVEAPRKTGPRLDDALDASEASAVLSAASGDRLEALAVVVLAVGLRQGEALSLQWQDLDLDAGTVAVVDAKTEAGIRTVALPPFATAALRTHRARQSAEQLAARYWADPTLVFATTVGTVLDRRNVLRWWHELTIRSGVGRRRFHASRHTAATLMLNAGVPLEVVSATLGHAGLAITADVYAKVRPQLQRRAADAMQTVLGSSR
jgi:integrase